MNNYETVFVQNRQYFTGHPSISVGSVLCWTFGILSMIIGVIVTATSYFPGAIHDPFNTGVRIYQTIIPPSWDIPQLLIGITLIIIGIVLVLLGFKYFLSDKKKIISGSTVDMFCNSMISDIISVAIEKLCLDINYIKEAEPIIMSGYNFLSNKQYLYRYDTKDYTMRCSEYQVTVLFFTQNQIYCFSREFSLIEPSQYDTTDVYFYQDVISVSTEHKPTKGGVAEYFSLTTSGGKYITASLSKQCLENVNSSISIIRNLLKNKK